MSNRPGLFQIIRNVFYNPDYDRGYTYEDYVLRDAGAFKSSTGGEYVNQDTGSKVSTVYNCVNLIAQDVAKLPLNVFRDEGEIRTPHKEHPTQNLITKKPNDISTAFSFWYSQVWQYLTWGNAYSLIMRDGNFMPKKLIPVAPDCVRLKTVDGEVFAQVHDYGIVPYYDILHFKMFTSDGLNGISPIIHNAEMIGKKIKEVKYGSRNLGSVPPVYISGNATPAQQEAIVENWKSAVHGDEIHKVPFLVGDINVTKLPIPPNELQYIETSIQTNKEIYGIFRVNPTKAQNFDQGVQANAEQQDISHLKDTLTPHLSMIAQECNNKLFSEQNKRNGYFVKHNTNSILRGDIKTRAEFYRVMKDGIMTPNEIRSKEDLPPKEGGDKLMIQGAMTPIEDAGEESIL